MRAKLSGLFVLLAVLSIVLGVPSVGGATPSTTRVYSLSGTTTITPGGPPGCFDCLAFSSVTTGSATCSACLPGDPISGSFTLSLPTITTYRPDPCRIKTISGTLQVIWDNGKSSTANMSGHFVDDKLTLHLTGTFDDEPLIQWAAHQAGIDMPNQRDTNCRQTTNPVSIALVISK
jgi:hypothetical protein